MDPLRATCTLKVKANSVKQEHEKQDELKRSALRAVAALLQIPKAGKFIGHVTPFLLTPNKSLRFQTKIRPLVNSYNSLKHRVISSHSLNLCKMHPLALRTSMRQV